jgi:hypothetical protein
MRNNGKGRFGDEPDVPLPPPFCSSTAILFVPQGSLWTICVRATGTVKMTGRPGHRFKSVCPFHILCC